MMCRMLTVFIYISWIASQCAYGIPNVSFMPLHNIELNWEEVATVNSMNELSYAHTNT